MTMRASNFMGLVAAIGLLCADGGVAGDSADATIVMTIAGDTIELTRASRQE
jgi:hypothetical protein